jgi:hypothetical protein
MTVTAIDEPASAGRAATPPSLRPMNQPARTPTPRHRATTKAVTILMQSMSPQERVALGQAAIDNQISVKEYVGELAAKNGLWHWIEPPTNDGPNEGNA